MGYAPITSLNKKHQVASGGSAEGQTFANYMSWVWQAGFRLRID